MCDNILELAGNPFTISPTEELHPDPTYDVNANLPWWIRSCRWVQKVLYDIAVWYNGIPWTVKLFTGIGLLAIALVLTLATGGGGMGVLSVLLQVAIGVGVGVGLYTIGSLLTGTFTWEGFANAALDAFLITSAIVFVSASVNALKTAARKSIVDIENDLSTYAESYRKSLKADPSIDQSKLQFASVTYDSKLGTYTRAYNSEIAGMTNDMLHSTLRGMGAKTSCAEIQAVNKALNAGSKLKNLYIYTVRTIDGAKAYACRVCTRVLSGNVAAIFTGIFPGF